MFRKSRTYFAKWAALSQLERKFFLRAAVVLVLVKCGLTVLPFSTFRNIFHYLSQGPKLPDLPSADINAAVWAVDTAANLLPLKLLCLPRALALKYILRHAQALTLEIGVEINPNKSFEAHAWVERNGTILIGDWSDSVCYQRIWVWS
ncbi:lasso peptide biosynthesis B2 protein [Dyadobacter sandarakinus]|uniref:Lasso peptide biosynthesis B2 protein n=1 Tax=Dyadobacter sandarakinus TaxID=2747268 RepID=A0ABX7I6K4_9BACT|nr:lasso peptide biosynthesis B2 protein [Dyadobacter sandarakinus]QRR01734.1 lasso peptide biosynthesis B2 protein [Dyadobacter sandarakinus]